jgi:Mn-dependent DtxR family transcriptional regulator
MSHPTVPDEVRRFILTCIPSVPYLEALLLLRSDPARAWGSFDVAARLYIGENQALDVLQAMHQSGMATRTPDGRFTYAPRAGELASVIDALAVTYSQHLVSVTDLIHSRVEKRAHQFADAFRWKKDDA